MAIIPSKATSNLQELVVYMWVEYLFLFHPFSLFVCPVFHELLEFAAPYAFISFKEFQELVSKLFSYLYFISLMSNTG